MACRCGKNFCYMCSKPWEPDHKDHFKCHIFKKRPDEETSREREVMERMNHCTERYIFNQAVANKYKEIDVFAKRKYLFKALHIDLTESEFMENAYRFTIECCEKLKWIYAFTYFYV
jgi:ariadne-1